MKNSLWKVAIYVVVIITGMLVALPNVLSDRMLAQLPSALPHQRVSLGLDLRGGSHLVLEVDRDSLVTEWLQNLQQDVRSTLEKSQITIASLRRTQSAIEVRLTDPAKVQQAISELNGIANQVQAAALTASDLTIEATGADTLRVLPSEAVLPIA